jgi:hypothetical protein
MYFEKDNEFDVGIKQAYPESLEELKILIKLFTNGKTTHKKSKVPME